MKQFEMMFHYLAGKWFRPFKIAELLFSKNGPFEKITLYPTLAKVTIVFLSVTIIS